MRKIFILAMVVMSIAVTSCKKDNDEPRIDDQYHSTTQLWPAYSPSSKMYGYIDASGSFVIPPQFDLAYNFSCGMGLVRMSDKYYFIDAKGQFKSSGYDDAWLFANGYACVLINGYLGLVDKNFNLVLQPMYYDLGDVYEGLIAYKLRSGEKMGYMDTKGNIVIQPSYSSASDFRDGLASVENSTYMIDKQGKIAIPAVYDRIVSLGNGCLGFVQGDKCGMTDLKGNVLAQPIYYNIWGDWANTGLFMVVDFNGNGGYLNNKGQVAIPLTFKDNLYVFYDQLTFAEMPNGNYAAIDRNGKTVFMLGENVYPSTTFKNGLALVYTYKNGNYTYQYLNQTGKVIYQWIETSAYAPERRKTPSVTLKNK